MDDCDRISSTQIHFFHRPYMLSVYSILNQNRAATLFHLWYMSVHHKPIQRFMHHNTACRKKMLMRHWIVAVTFIVLKNHGCLLQCSEITSQTSKVVRDCFHIIFSIKEKYWDHILYSEPKLPLYGNNHVLLIILLFIFYLKQCWACTCVHTRTGSA